MGQAVTTELTFFIFTPQQWKSSVQKAKEKENTETLASKNNVLLHGEEVRASYNTLWKQNYQVWKDDEIGS